MYMRTYLYNTVLASAQTHTYTHTHISWRLIVHARVSHIHAHAYAHTHIYDVRVHLLARESARVFHVHDVRALTHSHVRADTHASTRARNVLVRTHMHKYSHERKHAYIHTHM